MPLNQAESESVGLWSLLMLGLFVLANYFLLRGIWRRLSNQAAELRDSEEPGRVVREFTLDSIADKLFVSRASNVGNPLQRLRVEVSWIAFLLAADFGTIKLLWPWLLP